MARNPQVNFLAFIYLSILNCTYLSWISLNDLSACSQFLVMSSSKDGMEEPYKCRQSCCGSAPGHGRRWFVLFPILDVSGAWSDYLLKDVSLSPIQRFQGPTHRSRHGRNVSQHMARLICAPVSIIHQFIQSIALPFNHLEQHSVSESLGSVVLCSYINEKHWITERSVLLCALCTKAQKVGGRW